MSGHSHNHGGGCCDHPHDVAGDLGAAYSLYSKIDLDRVECLNESEEGTGKTVFKPWDQRLDFSRFVDSDCDEELLLKIPFTGNVKLKGIIILGADDDSHPSRLRIFKNNPHMSFDNTSLVPEQELELIKDTQGTLEYPLKAVKFSNIFHLTLHFSRNFGSETTRIFYIGLKGDFTPAQRDAILITNYELAPNPCDHRVNRTENVTHEIN